jgi:hypothetical protein
MRMAIRMGTERGGDTNTRAVFREEIQMAMGMNMNGLNGWAEEEVVGN